MIFRVDVWHVKEKGDGVFPSPFVEKVMNRAEGEPRRSNPYSTGGSEVGVTIGLLAVGATVGFL